MGNGFLKHMGETVVVPYGNLPVRTEENHEKRFDSQVSGPSFEPEYEADRPRRSMTLYQMHSFDLCCLRYIICTLMLFCLGIKTNTV